jgi:hypothetical protein
MVVDNEQLVSALEEVSDSVWISGELLAAQASTEDFHHCGDCE